MVSWNLLPIFGLAPRSLTQGGPRQRSVGRLQVERVEERLLTSVFGSDDRVKVKATGAYPFSAVVMVPASLPFPAGTEMSSSKRQF